ncbi:MAG: pyrimidine 5'-nucleotidase [Pseudomonadota bacterium]
MTQNSALNTNSPPSVKPKKATDWRGIENWVFDLDNTLYPARCHLFHQIDGKMTEFIQSLLDLEKDDARKIQKDYYAKYGTTLSGLMKEHRVAPEDFLHYVHDIDVSIVPQNLELAKHIQDLPGKKFIFTNGSVAHAENVLKQIGLSGLFSDIFDIAAAAFTPKPHMEAYNRFLDRTNIVPKTAVMFEDIAHNLKAPHALGMRTVLICADADWMQDEPVDKRPAHISDPTPTEKHVHHVTEDISDFLGGILRKNL